MISLTKSLAMEYGRYGIRSNIVLPGTVRTPIWEERKAGRRQVDAGAAAQMVSARPHRRADRRRAGRRLPRLRRRGGDHRRRPAGRLRAHRRQHRHDARTDARGLLKEPIHGPPAHRRHRPRLVRRDPLRDHRRRAEPRTRGALHAHGRSGWPSRRRSSASRRPITDYRQLLADPDIDAVSIVTMWDQHTEPAIAALKAGKHVFLEKPMASTVADCNTIIAAAEGRQGHPADRPHLPLQSALPHGQAGDRRGPHRQDRGDESRAATSPPPGRRPSSTRSARSSATPSTTPT